MAYHTASRTDRKLAARLAALGSLGAAVIHFAVAPAHWQEWIPAGAFFASVGALQLIWAWFALTRAAPRVLASGVALNLSVVAIWVLSRTSGPPLGPHAGEPEVVGAADLCALLLQIYVVMGAGWALYRGRDGEQISGFANAVVLLGACVVIALTSSVGVTSSVRHGHHASIEPDHAHEGPSANHAHLDHGEPVPDEARPPIVESSRTPATVPSVPRVEPVHEGPSEHHHD